MEEKVVNALRDADFEPYDQLVGYVLNGHPMSVFRETKRKAAAAQGVGKVIGFSQVTRHCEIQKAMKTSPHTHPNSIHLERELMIIAPHLQTVIQY